MASYMKLFEDFLHRKECNGTREAAATSDDEDIEHQITNIQSINSSGDGNNKMEHSYTRDNTRAVGSVSTGLSPARTILVRRTPQCPACHTHPLEEHDFDECNQADVPSYNEIAAKEAMNECSRIAKYVKNNNPDDDDWESRINQTGWSNMQKTLFSKVANILDNDQLGRLANANRQNEPMQRRAVVDKSASRMRKALAAIAWDSRLTQWLHCLLMDSLPSTYMASYLDILQTLKSKLPTLMDKMLFGRPLNVSQELLAPVMKNKWEPIVNTKVRKLTQNAVIVALPSLPTSGPVPHKLQKWYHQLASITQIVQVTLPSNVSHIARQPLEQVAEQIVSLTRVKIQELRNENSQRSIILIGFNAGAALALQVAMSENIACVVCMGFAYNTFNGVRGTPDDRILDIKIPILFVIGQNSAKTSTEEIESLREKMQSETSLVVVGSADDVLRVPKSRRKLENVTQSMVDAMVVDEVYEFIKRILANPPGPRVPTTITNLVHTKQGRSAIGNTVVSTSSEGNTKISGVQRKRKNEVMNSDQEQTPVKAKCVQSIGRPRTRPLNMTTTTPAKTTQTASKSSQQQAQKSPISPNSAITNEDLNMAIQSILGDSNEHDGSIFNSSTESSQGTQKIVTNYEIVAPSKSTPIKTALLNPLQNKVIPAGAKIKMIPSNQFVQLKPPMQSQSKIYTIKTASMQQNTASGSTSIGSIVSTSPTGSTAAHHQQQIFTLKSPNGQTTQFVTAAPPGTAHQKYSVVKNTTSGTTLQIGNTGLSGVKSTGTTLGSGSSTSNLDLSNIIDMPIVFADNDGNLSDSVVAPAASTKPANTSGVGQLIISQKIIKEANSSAANNTGVASTVTTSPKTGGGTYIINKTAGSPLLQHTAQTSASKQNKVVFINRNTMKPCPNIISRSNIAQQLPKYAKVVVTNPKTSATTIVPRPATQLSTTTVGGSSSSSPFVSSVKQVNLQTLKSPVSIGARQTSGILNVSTKSLPQVQIIGTTAAGAAISPTLGNATNTATSAAVSGGSGVLADRPHIRNIVVKPGGLKQIPAQLKSQLLNRNLTVRKLVNIIPASKAVGASTTSTGVTIVAQSGGVSSEASGSGGSSSGTSIQTSPKVITLNPINPSAAIGNTGSDTNNSVASGQPKN